MKSSALPIKHLLQSTSLPFGDSDDDAQVYTPREFVSGFISPPRGANPLEAAWHAAAVALETERIRVVQHEADGGIYFMAADAGDFVNHPNAMTPLASAMPGAAGHKGDGAYFVDLGSGVVAVVVKKELSLRCYVGERSEAMRFADGCTCYWPNEAESWVGFRQLESRHARHLAKMAVLVGMVLTGIFIVLSVVASGASEMLLHRKEVALDNIRAEQQKTASQFNVEHADAYADYRKLATPIVALGGKLVHFESTGEKNTWNAEFPSWTSDLSALGTGFKSRIENAHVIVNK